MDWGFHCPGLQEGGTLYAGELQTRLSDLCVMQNFRTHHCDISRPTWRHGILTPFNHGFRSKLSCETQLLLTLQDLLTFRDRKIQVDMSILDFSKAFHTVPHDHLLGKMEFYGIQGPLLKWTASFLKTRSQSVLVEGKYSKPAKVLSGVPQGTVLCPLLFLIHINDLPSVVTSQVRLFADDCLMYRPVHSLADQLALARWGDAWGIFTPYADRCFLW